MDDGDSGRSERSEEVTAQEILIAFDTTDESVLTVSELAEAVDATETAVRQRLHELREEGRVDSRRTGPASVVWWAEVAPRLAPEAVRDIEAARRDETVPLGELEDDSDNE